ncbi:MAG: resuscitation-promoting factor RpfB [Actinomycetota bacterium]|nr:resuscitation-promoting factor RpfB [Actinomycetota bacterium]
MTVSLAVIALALPGALPSSGASGNSPAPPSPTVVAPVVPRGRTAVDAARATLPLPVPRGVVAATERASRDGLRGRSVEAVWAALARCESSDNPDAVGGGGRYYGAFQFSVATWRSVGGTGLPTDHPYEVQLAAAQRLQARRGWSQWPACARRLGLRS